MKTILENDCFWCDKTIPVGADMFFSSDSWFDECVFCSESCMESAEYDDFYRKMRGLTNEE